MCADPIGEIERLGDQLGRAAQAIAVPAEFQWARIKIGVCICIGLCRVACGHRSELSGNGVGPQCGTREAPAAQGAQRVESRWVIARSLRLVRAREIERGAVASEHRTIKGIGAPPGGVSARTVIACANGVAASGVIVERPGRGTQE